MKQKRITIVLLLLGFFFCSYGQTADEIVNKYITAIGGLENWKKVNSVFYEAAMEKHGVKVKVYNTVLHGKGARQNMVVGENLAFEIYTPAEAWEFKYFKGQQKPVKLDELTVKQNADRYDAQGILVDYKTKGHTVEYIGKETIENKNCFVLKVTQKNGKMEQMYFDTETNLLFSTVSDQKINGTETKLTTRYDKYNKTEGGIFFPMEITNAVGLMVVTKVEINKQVSENIFKPMN